MFFVDKNLFLDACVLGAEGCPEGTSTGRNEEPNPSTVHLIKTNEELLKHPVSRKLALTEIETLLKLD